MTKIGNNTAMRYANDPDIERQIAQFGANMREARRRASMTQTDLASIDGLDRAAISLTEKGRRSPDMRTLLRIAEGLNVTAAELVRGIGPHSSDGRPTSAPAAPAPPDADAGPSHNSSKRTSQTPGSPTAFSQNLYMARRGAGISQQTLGARADVDAAAISLYERGQRQPNLRTVLKLARTLQISPVALLHGVR